jgi:uncharacterized membrane protein
MKQWLLERAKAFAAAFAAGLVSAAIKAVETTFDIDIGIETETMLISAVSGIVTYAIPNKPPVT